ncbi:MAG: AsmA family protein [Alphaproteobacteria bacterium]|nr:AsmA family protein [Alphaproteobacteria bacterium]
MRWVLGALLAILAVITLAVAILVYLVPDTAIERHILASAGRATNSTITTSGPPDITLFPQIDMTLRGIEIEPAGGAGTIALTAQKVHAQVSWISILTQWTIDIAELQLVEPRLQLADADPARRAQVQPQARFKLYPPLTVVVRQIGIENGSIDGVSDWRIKDINAKVPAANLSSALDVDVELFLNGEKVAGNIKLKDPLTIQSGRNIPVAANLDAQSARIEFDGTANVGAGPLFDGKVTLATADIDAVSRWLGLGAASDFEGKRASLSGSIRYETGAIVLQDAEVELADLKANVDGRFAAAGKTYVGSDVTIKGFDTKRFGLPEGVLLANPIARFKRLEAGAPVSAALDFDLNGEPVSGTASVPDLALLIAANPGEPLSVKTDFTVPGGQIAFDGKVTSGPKADAGENADGWSAVGQLNVEADSARRMSNWLGFALPNNDAYATALFYGEVAASPKSVSARAITAKLDHTAVAGDFSVDLSSVRPLVTAKLRLDRIDTSRYVAAAPASVEVARRAAAPEPAAPPYEILLEPLKPTLESYLAGTEAAGPTVHAPGGAPARRELAVSPAVREVWSQASLGLEQLRQTGADLDLDVTVGDLRHGDIVLGKSALATRLQKGSLEIDVREVQPVEGRISGKIKIDTGSEAPAYDLALDIGGVPIEKVLQQAGQRDVLRGKLTGTAQLTASGRSVADIAASLTGIVRSEFRDGLIVGYDIRRALRPFANREYDPRNTTPYERIRADFAIADGYARSDSITLDGPAISVRGAGSANLKTAALDYQSQISLVPPPSNFSIPVKILGTWNRIKAALDWARVASQWTGESPFQDLEVRRRTPSRSIDPELKPLVEELVAKAGGKGLPPAAADLINELTGR